MKTQIEIFIAFFRSGILGFGGGPAAIPLVQKEVVTNFKMMTDEEFIDVLAIGNTLPGPIATKMAGYIGYKVGGVIGLFNALIAAVLPSAVAMILLLTVLHEYSELPFIKGMTNGVVPVVGVMMALLTVEFFKKGKTALGWQKNLFLLGIAILAIWVLHIHPGIVIFVLLLFAFFLPIKEAKK